MPLPIFLSDLPPVVVHQSTVHQTAAGDVAAVQISPPPPAQWAEGELAAASPPEVALETAVETAPEVTLEMALETDQGASPWRDGAVPAVAPWPALAADAEPTEGAGPETTVPLPEASPPGETAPEPLDPALLRLLADTQTFSPERQVVTASGNVLLQFGDTQLAAERLWVNLNNRYLRAEGEVFFNRNQQILEGDTATYNLLQGSGRITNGRGVLRVSTLAEDFSVTAFPSDLTTQPLDYRLQDQGSISQVTSPGGYSFVFNSTAFILGGEPTDVGRLRFETSQIDFNADGWYGDNLRLTNDPFSPPELELRGNRVSFVPLSEEDDELCIDNPRLVFDQGLSLPLVRRCYQLQRGQLPANAFNPLLTSIGYDNRDRDGFFIEREFPAIETGSFQVSLSPQFYISRWLDQDGGLADLANLGLVARARGSLGPRTSATGLVSLPGLDLQNFADRVRANLRVQQLVGTHRLGVEYTYRDRLFNGSLGFQDVQASLGVLLESPVIPVGSTGFNLTYQLSGQYVTANTDRSALLDPGVGVGLTSLFRVQGAADLSRNFLLWQGEAKPSTASEGLRYSPRPLVPSLSLLTGLRGVATYYTSNDIQESLDARVAIVGQLGHLSRDYLDYTQFNLGLSSSFIGGEGSPFLFDRLVDQNTLSGGLVQQIYGPFLLGFQTAFNLDTGRAINTSFSVEYRRRTYGLVAQYSPTQETGFFGFRLSQFDWVGRPDPFDGEATNQNLQVQ